MLSLKHYQLSKHCGSVLICILHILIFELDDHCSSHYWLVIWQIICGFQTSFERLRLSYLYFKKFSFLLLGKTFSIVYSIIPVLSASTICSIWKLLVKHIQQFDVFWHLILALEGPVMTVSGEFFTAWLSDFSLEIGSSFSNKEAGLIWHYLVHFLTCISLHLFKKKQNLLTLASKSITYLTLGRTRVRWEFDKTSFGIVPIINLQLFY